MTPTEEDAVQVWIRDASGLPSARVRWSGGDRVPAPYISLRAMSDNSIGTDWAERRRATSPSPGSEITYVLRGSREAQLSIQCFGDGAMGLLGQCKLALADPGVMRLLAAANVGIGNIDGPTSIDGVQNSTLLESRALMSVTLLLAVSVERPGTYVENVGMTGYIPNEADPDETLVSFVPTGPSDGDLVVTLGAMGSSGAGAVTVDGDAVPALGGLSSSGAGTVV